MYCICKIKYRCNSYNHLKIAKKETAKVHNFVILM